MTPEQREEWETLTPEQRKEFEEYLQYWDERDKEMASRAKHGLVMGPNGLIKRPDSRENEE